MLHPRVLLSTAADIVCKAVEDKANIIEAPAVRPAVDDSPILATPDF